MEVAADGVAIVVDACGVAVTISDDPLPTTTLTVTSVCQEEDQEG